MSKFEQTSNPTIKIHPDQYASLERTELRVRKLLRECGFRKKYIAQSVHLDIDDAYERKSAVSSYEALRATHILQDTARRAGLDEADGVAFTVALPSHRRKHLCSYSPNDAFRKWRRSLKRLSDRGFVPIGICVVEINQTTRKDGRVVYEPHLHGVIWRAPIEEVRQAFSVRRSAKGAVRNRPTHFEALDNLNGYLGYLTKFVPEYRLEPPVPRKDGRWWRGKLVGHSAREWLEFMSRYRVHDLIKFRGIDDVHLGVDGMCELTPVGRQLSSKGPKGGRKGPSRPGGRR